MRSVELFAGAGGLAMGISNAGFHHEAVVEWDKDACKTLRENQQCGLDSVVNSSIFEADVSEFNCRAVKGEIDLLTGGPPCQPFSIGGKHFGYLDKRDMFPPFFRIVRELKPKVILIENVKGLLRPSFAEYFEYIILQLTYPEVVYKTGENWIDHLSRLERHHVRGDHDGLSYRVVFRLLNAANYGIPQKRERVFIVGFRSDLNVEWSFPTPTHSLDALLWKQWVTGDYWEQHQVPKSSRPQIPSKLKSRVQQLQSSLFPPTENPWRTVRDAIYNLPDPEQYGTVNTTLNHIFIPGARSYLGHTGSLLDQPAKTLKAGVHGVPGGENTLVLPNDQVRYFTVREAARLQTFPDNYIFPCSWTTAMRLLGNAVPVTLAQVLASNIRLYLERVYAGYKHTT